MRICPFQKLSANIFRLATVDDVTSFEKDGGPTAKHKLLLINFSLIMIYAVSCGYSQSPLYRHPVIVLIRPHDTSHYYGQFALSQVGKKALTFL